MESGTTQEIKMRVRLISRLVIGCLVLGLSALSGRAQEDPALFRIGKGNVLGFIDRDGRMLVEPKYQYVDTAWWEGCLWVRESFPLWWQGLETNAPSGNFIGPDGVTISARPLSELDCFREPMFRSGMALVRLSMDERDCAYIDKAGRILFHTPRWYLGPDDAGLWVMVEDGKFGYATRSGKVVVPATFDECGSFTDGFAPVRRGSEWGIIDSDGKWVLEPSYSEMRRVEGDHTLLRYRSGIRWGVLRNDGKVLTTAKFDEVGHGGYGVVTVRIGDKWGLVTDRGCTVLEPQFEGVGAVTPYVVAVSKSNLWGLVSLDGSVVQEPVFSSLSSGGAGGPFVGRMRLAGGGSVLLDERGKRITAPAADDYLRVGNDRAFFRQDEKWGLMTTAGEVLIEATYDDVGGFEKQGLFGVARRRMRGLVDTVTGREVLPTTHERVVSWHGLVRCIDGGTNSFCTRSGTVLVSKEEGITNVTEERYMYDGYGVIEGKTGAGVISKDGRIVLPMRYERAGFPSEDLVPVQVGGQWGYVDLRGRSVVTPRFADAGSFSEGVAFVQSGGAYGFIDHRGEFVIEPKYAAAGYSLNGLLPVAVRREGGTDAVWGVAALKWGLIDRQGNTVLPVEHEVLEWGSRSAKKRRLYGRMFSREISVWEDLDTEGGRFLVPWIQGTVK